MIRLATLDDVPQIVHGLYQLWDTTPLCTWGDRPDPRVGTAILEAQFLRPDTTMYVSEQDGRVVAFCGVRLDAMFFAPQVGAIWEWGWYGPPREAVRVWRAACAWGREHGARWAGRSQVHAESTPARINESRVWERLDGGAV